MSPGTAATMVVVLGLVWGGFIAALLTAMRKEGRKGKDEAGQEEVE